MIISFSTPHYKEKTGQNTPRELLYACAANRRRVPSNTRTKPIMKLSAGRHASLKRKMRKIGYTVGNSSTPGPHHTLSSNAVMTKRAPPTIVVITPMTKTMIPIVFILSLFADYDYTVLNKNLNITDSAIYDTCRPLVNCAVINLVKVHSLSFSTTVESTRFLLVCGDSPFRFWLPGIPFFPREFRK